MANFAIMKPAPDGVRLGKRPFHCCMNSSFEVRNDDLYSETLRNFGQHFMEANQNLLVDCGRFVRVEYALMTNK